jgi:hypothetical protein
MSLATLIVRRLPPRVGYARLVAALAMAGALLVASPAGATAAATPPPAFDPGVRPPQNACLIPFEDIEGTIITTLSIGAGGRDTSGAFVLDTGAGYLALSPEVIVAFGLADSLPGQLTFAPRSLPWLRIGALEEDVVAPILAVETRVVEQVIDRKVLGLLGQAPLSAYALWIDYQRDSLALIPMPRDGLTATPARRVTAVDLAAASAMFGNALAASKAALGAGVSGQAIALPFRLATDGKIVVSVHVADAAEPLSLVLDTGANKTVLFEDAIHDRVPGLSSWRKLRGLSAPTLYGAEDAYMTRVPKLALAASAGTASARDVDAAVISGGLSTALTSAVGSRVDGLLGYSFLRRFRVTIDFPHRLLWLDPVDVSQDQRVYEYSHVGLQIERRDQALRVVAVAEDSPAARAGIRTGDELISIDGQPASGFDVIGASRRLEGPPGSRITLVARHDGVERTYRLVRRQLL